MQSIFRMLLKYRKIIEQAQKNKQKQKQKKRQKTKQNKHTNKIRWNY